MLRNEALVALSRHGEVTIRFEEAWSLGGYQITVKLLPKLRAGETYAEANRRSRSAARVVSFKDVGNAHADVIGYAEHNLMTMLLDDITRRPL